MNQSKLRPPCSHVPQCSWRNELDGFGRLDRPLDIVTQYPETCHPIAAEECRDSCFQRRLLFGHDPAAQSLFATCPAAIDTSLDYRRLGRSRVLPLQAVPRVPTLAQNYLPEPLPVVDQECVSLALLDQRARMQAVQTEHTVSQAHLGHSDYVAVPA